MRSHECRRGWRAAIPGEGAGSRACDVEAAPLPLCQRRAAAGPPGAQPERRRARRAVSLPRVPPPSPVPSTHSSALMQDTLGALLAVGLVYVVVRFAFGSSSGSSSAGRGGGAVPGGASVAPQAGAQRGAAQRRNMAGVSDEMVSCAKGARMAKRDQRQRWQARLRRAQACPRSVSQSAAGLSAQPSHTPANPTVVRRLTALAFRCRP